MHNLRHFYYQNKEKIWKVILIVAFVLGMIYFLNSFIIENNNNKITNTQSNTFYKYKDEEKTYIQGTSAISGENISKSEANKVNDTISKFIRFCKSGKNQEAYDMLSDDCKGIRFKSLEKFTTEYINSKFNQAQTYSIQKWEANTYKVEISEDMLATGNVNNSTKILEYITIVEQDGQNKLNINEFIEKKKINKVTTQDKIRMTVIEKDVYMDYEIYKLKVQNLADKTIKLDSFENTGSIYLEDRNGNTYKAHKNEILEHELIISPKMIFELEIKFGNTYKLGTDITKIIFEDVILDYDVYKKLENTDEFEDMCELEVNL